MRGLAKQRFEDITGTSLIKQKRHHIWPLLQKAQQLGCISFTDLTFAEMLMENATEKDELTAAFLCHLSLAVRAGHLCVYKTCGELSPSPFLLWFSDVSEENVSDIKALLQELVEKEVKLPQEVVTDVLRDVNTFPLTPICRLNDLYYYQKYWLFESSFSKALKCLLSQEPILRLNQEYVNVAVQQLSNSNLLNEQQAQAILNTSQTCFSIICGGPGTGKTYTAGHLIKIFWQSLSPEQQSNYEIVLAAPTGKAANNLQKSLKSTDFPGNITAKTLHALLEVRSSGKMTQKSYKKLNADLIIVDESSMIDVRLMAYLFDSIKAGARIILLGDPYQLPPVEVGSLFNDMIQMLAKRSRKNVSELKTCLRAELKEIVEFSQWVNAGMTSEIISHLNIQNKDAAVSKIPYESSSKKAVESILEIAEDRIPSCKYNPEQDPMLLLHSYNKFRLLSPLRNGSLGIVEINRLIHQRRLGRVAWGEYTTTPIMITENDYKRELFNGEVGVLVSRKKKNGNFNEDDFAIFSGTAEEPYRKIAAILLPKFEHAYCLSVHKSQGSEFDHVLLLLPEGSERFGREVLYTAVTRAKRKLQLWSSLETLMQTISNKSERLSGLREAK